MIDKKIRKDFPILKRKINGHPLVYLDNAAPTQKPEMVIDAVSDFYRKSNANPYRGIHTLADEATVMVENARDKIAGFIGANAGGLIHEAKNIQSGRPFMESVEDATNNLAGSLASVFSRNTSEKILDFYKKIAPDGKVKN